MSLSSNFLLSNLFNLTMGKIYVPTDFHSRCSVIEEMLESDCTGLTNTLTDFSVNSAAVNYQIRTNNEEFNKTLTKWLDTINIDYDGQIPIGIREVAKMYFQERWKYSSFPVLKLVDWTKINGIQLPTKMFFVKGGSINAQPKDTKSKSIKLINYDYTLGSDNEPLNKGVIFSRPYGRVWDKYPTPYLIQRGVYHNYKLIQLLKSRQADILNQVIPALLKIRMGSEAKELNLQTYDEVQLKQVSDQMEKLMQKMNNLEAGDKLNKGAIDAANWDKQLEYLIPDISSIFNKELFVVAERSVLSGLGFVDVVSAISDSRKESILSPKVFIQEVKTGVEDFKQILKQIMYRVIKENKNSHKKYLNQNTEFFITNTPISIFQSDKFKDVMRQLYDRGLLSKQTATEVIGEIEFTNETQRRQKETKKGLDYIHYPPIRDNVEKDVPNFPSDINKKPKTEDVKGNPIPEDKVDKLDRKDKYNVSSKEKLTLEGAPYKNIEALPKNVKNPLPKEAQKIYLEVFNSVLKETGDEDIARKSAWSQIKKSYKKDEKSGKWLKKEK